MQIYLMSYILYIRIKKNKYFFKKLSHIFHKSQSFITISKLIKSPKTYDYRFINDNDTITFQCKTISKVRSC